MPRPITVCSAIMLVVMQLYSRLAIAGDGDTLVKKNRISFNPSRVVGLVNPGYEFGFERLHSDRYATRVMGALLTNSLNTAPFFTYSGYRVGIEEKRFLSHAGNSDSYLSVEAVYHQSQFSSIYQFMPDRDTQVYWYRSGYLDSIGVSNRSLSVNVKLGIQFRSGRFIMDAYCGLGLRYKVLTHSDRIDPADYIYSRHPNVYNAGAAEVNGITMSLPFNILFAYCF